MGTGHAYPNVARGGAETERGHGGGSSRLAMCRRVAKGIRSAHLGRVRGGGVLMRLTVGRSGCELEAMNMATWYSCLCRREDNEDDMRDQGVASARGTGLRACGGRAERLASPSGRGGEGARTS